MLRNKEVRINHKIVAFTGLMHSGKTRSAEALESILTMSIFYPKMIKFAQPLYDIQEYIYNRTRLEKPKSKDRELLQYLGTEWGRKKNENLWIDLWRSEARLWRFKSSDHPDDVNVVICDDLRFDNEAKLVKALGGVIINVVAPTEMREERSPETFIGNSHTSEQGVSEDLIDLTIYNDKELSDLRQNIRYLLEERLV